MKKKLILLVTLIVSLIAITATAGAVNYEVLEFDSSGRVYDCNENASGDVVIPDYINVGDSDEILYVTAIGYDAFRDCTDLDTITLNAYISKIESGAFSGCTGLKAIYVDEANPHYKSVDGVLYTKSGDTLVMYPAGRTESFAVPEEVYLIGERAFDHSAASEIILHDQILWIKEFAFADCDELTNLDLPDSLIRIEDHAFAGCNGITEMTIPATVRFIGNEPIGFHYDENEGWYVKGDSFVIKGHENTEAENYANYYEFTFVSLGEYIAEDTEALPEWLESIIPSYDGTCEIQKGNVNYSGAVEIPQVINGMIVVGIDDYAFQDCIGITGVTIPSTVTEIGSSAFRNCSSLKTVDLNSESVDMGASVFMNCTALTDVELPGNLMGLSYELFSGCTSLKEIELPLGLVSIADNAFAGCTSLEYINIPVGVNSLGSKVFYGCTALKGVVLNSSDSGYISIGTSCFENCTSLENVVLQENLSVIENSAFRNCDSLEGIIPPETLTQIGAYAFADCDNLQIVYLPEALVEIGEGIVFGSDNAYLYCTPYSYGHAYAEYYGIDYELFLSSFLDDDGTGTWAWASEYIYNCVNAGLITGYTDGTFLPDKNITRAEFVTILYKTYLGLGGEEVNMGHPFTDASDSWYQNALSWAYWSGVVTGTSGTTFSPSATITRQEMATIMYRFMNTFFELEEIEYNDLSGFADRGSVASWAMEGVQFCVTCGIINGTSETTLSPTASATRAQAATIISRTFIE